MSTPFGILIKKVHHIWHIGGSIDQIRREYKQNGKMIKTDMSNDAVIFTFQK